MITCYCVSFGCNQNPKGRQLPGLEAQKHRAADRQSAEKDAHLAAEKAIETQELDLSAAVAAMTLAGSATERPSCREVPSPGILNDCFASLSISEHEHPHIPNPVDDPLLDVVAGEANFLLKSEQSLATLHTTSILHQSEGLSPMHRDSPFPLNGAISDVRSLEATIRNCLTRSPALKQRRKLLLEKVLDLEAQLIGQQKRWKNEATALSPPIEISTHTNVYDSEHHFSDVLLHADPLVQLSLFIMATLRVVYHSSRDSCRWLLQMFSFFVLTALKHRSGTTVQSEAKLVKTFPRDPDTVISHLHLESKTTIYAVCPNPKCHKLYPPVARDGNPQHPEYPEVCSYNPYSRNPESAPCGERLTTAKLVNNVVINVPLKHFVFFDFYDWLAGLLSRPGYEDYMDAAWNRKDTDTMSDVFDGQFLREFKGPDGERHFSVGGSGARYVFSLCLDNFNPHTNKQAGKKASVGMMSMALLNLPPHLRYRPECLYLAGVIPGPNEPPLDAVNHYLEPLVDIFLKLWNTGTRISHTYNHPEGRLVNCALILIVADLLGAKKIAGFASHHHEYFCSICLCTRSTGGYQRADYDAWTRRTNDSCRHWGARYLAADNDEDRLNVFNQQGIRWSQLVRLPYFDMARCVVVDSMHNLFLGLLKEHFTNVLGIGSDTAKAPKPAVLNIQLTEPPPDMDPLDKKSIQTIVAFLQAPSSSIFQGDEEDSIKRLTGNPKYRAKALEFVARQLCPANLRNTGRAKKPYAKALLNWRRSAIEVDDGSTTACGFVLTPSEMKEIRDDIQNMITPSWLTSVPINLGSASHGKLKADQWRVLGTTYLPITLIRLWGAKGGSPSVRASRCQSILQITIAMLSAVVLATSRKATKANAMCYRDLIQTYMKGIKMIFPDYKFRPNHHMSMHLHEFILDFGPPHGWWTFPFERLIGLLQRMPHNGKIGELESTITRAFNRAANLRGLLEKPQCPQIIRDCKTLFHKFADPHIRSTLLTDTSTFAAMFEGIGSASVSRDDDVWDDDLAKPTPPDVSRILAGNLPYAPPRRSVLLKALFISGLRYTIPSAHHGNSLVLIKSDHHPYAAQIQYIIQFRTSDALQTLLIIQRYLPVEEGDDIYSRYPVLGAKMWKTKMGVIEVVEPQRVLCHFACLHLSEDEMVAVDLSREFLFS